MHLKSILLALSSGGALLLPSARVTAALPSSSVDAVACSHPIDDSLGQNQPNEKEETRPPISVLNPSAITPSLGSAGTPEASLFQPDYSAKQEWDVPHLTYTPLKSPSYSNVGSLVPSQNNLLSTLVQRRVGEAPRWTMTIITPRSDIDYKLTIIAADPTIDPKMLIPADPPSSARAPKR